MHLIISVPAPQIQEQVVEVIKAFSDPGADCRSGQWFLKAVLLSSIFWTGVFGGLWFACKGTSDSTGGCAHNPLTLFVDDRGAGKRSVPVYVDELFFLFQRLA